MKKHLKINIAIFLSLAFLFRIVFINAGLLSETGTTPSKQFLARNFTSLKKRKREVTSMQMKDKNYTMVEIVEERSNDEEGQVRISSFNLFTIRHSFLSIPLSTIKSVSPFDAIKCNLYHKKYLSLSVLRI
jgi:hypothetical protein